MVYPTTSIFQLYNRWSQNTNESKKSSMQVESGTRSADDRSDPPDTVLIRPHDLFQKRLAGICVNSTMKAQDARKKCLTELMNETPADLLSSELWFNSLTPGHWWSVVKNYSRSLALMSAIGLLVGLGDRHLCNLLVNFSSGQIIHVDYNICFDKGKLLRTPETVPFRLTRNFVDALGLGGVEGPFTSDVTKVISHIRGMSLFLENVLVDSLDSTSLFASSLNNESPGYMQCYNGGVSPSTKYSPNGRRFKQMQSAKRMFSLRVRELQTPWNNLKTAFLELKDKISLSVTGYEALVKTNHDDVRIIRQMDAMKTYLNEFLDWDEQTPPSQSLASGDRHPLSDLAFRSKEHMKLSRRVAEMQYLIQKKIDTLKNSSGKQIRLCLAEFQAVDESKSFSNFRFPRIGSAIKLCSATNYVEELNEDERLCRLIEQRSKECRKIVKQVNDVISDLHSGWLEDLPTIDLDRLLGVNYLLNSFNNILDAMRKNSLNGSEHAPDFSKWLQKRNILIRSIWSEVESYYAETKRMMSRFRSASSVEKGGPVRVCPAQESAFLPLLLKTWNECGELEKATFDCTNLFATSKCEECLFDGMLILINKSCDLVSLALESKGMEHDTFANDSYQCLKSVRDVMLSLQELFNKAGTSVLPVLRLAQFRVVSCDLLDLSNLADNLLCRMETETSDEIEPCGLDRFAEQLIGSVKDNAVRESLSDLEVAFRTTLDAINQSFNCFDVMFSSMTIEVCTHPYLASNKAVNSLRFSETTLSRLEIKTSKVFRELLSCLRTMIEDLDISQSKPAVVTDQKLMFPIIEFVQSVLSDSLTGLYTLALFCCIYSFVELDPPQRALPIPDAIRAHLSSRGLENLEDTEENKSWVQQQINTQLLFHQDYFKSCLKFKLREFELLKLVSLDTSPVRKLCGVCSIEDSLQKLKMLKGELKEMKDVSMADISKKLATLDQNVLKRVRWISGGGASDVTDEMKQISSSRHDHLETEISVLDGALDSVEAALGFDDLLGEVKQVVKSCIEYLSTATNNAAELINSMREANQSLSEVEQLLLNDKKFTELVWTRSEIIGFLHGLNENLVRVKKRKSDNDEHIRESKEILILLSGQLTRLLETFNTLSNDLLQHASMLRKLVDDTSRIEEFQSVLSDFKVDMKTITRCMHSGQVITDPVLKEFLQSDRIERIFDKPDELIQADFQPAALVPDDGMTAWINFKRRLKGQAPDGSILSPEEQVKQAIAQSVDVNNLAAMYEGWTAWV